MHNFRETLEMQSNVNVSDGGLGDKMLAHNKQTISHCLHIMISYVSMQLSTIVRDRLFALQTLLGGNCQGKEASEVTPVAACFYQKGVRNDSKSMLWCYVNSDV